MPDPPNASVFMRYVLENPWPLGLFLLAVAGVVGWRSMREATFARLPIAAGLALAGAAALLTGAWVVTPGEQAKGVTRQLVEAAVAQDVVAGAALFSDDASIAIGSVKNPGMGKEFIIDKLDTLRGAYAIESNSITMLKGFTESADAATVHLGCRTQLQNFPYPNATQWVLQVRRQPDGSWKITRVTWISVNGDPATRWW